jgi:hypothetical protein
MGLFDVGIGGAEAYHTPNFRGVYPVSERRSWERVKSL